MSFLHWILKQTRDVCAISEFMRRNVGLLHSRQMFVKKNKLYAYIEQQVYMIMRNRCSQNILQLVHNVIKQMFSFNIGFIPIISRDVTRVNIYAGERATQPYSISGGGGYNFSRLRPAKPFAEN